MVPGLVPGIFFVLYTLSFGKITPATGVAFAVISGYGKCNTVPPGI
jgi:hypothetical protein